MLQAAGFPVGISKACQVIYVAPQARISVHSSCVAKIFQKISALSRDHSAKPLCRAIWKTPAPSQSVASASPVGGRRRCSRFICRPDPRQQPCTVLFCRLACYRFQGKSPRVSNYDTLFQSLYHRANLCCRLRHWCIRDRRGHGQHAPNGAALDG